MTGVFEVLAADEEDVRISSRKALLLAESRISKALGSWLAFPRTAEDYEAAYEYSKDQFEGIVREACEEVGHGNSEAIANTLKAHFNPIVAKNPIQQEKEDDEDLFGEEEPDEDDKKTSSVREARRPRMCPYHSEVVDISLGAGDPQAGYNAMSSHTWGPRHCQGGEYEGGKCNFKREMVTQSYWDDRQKHLDEQRQLRQEQTGEVPLPQEALPEDTIDQDLSDTGESESFDHAEVQNPVDINPISDSTMALAASVQAIVPLKEERDEVPDRVSASPKGQEYNPSNQRDESGKQVPCPQCGGNGKTANDQKCPKCEGRGKVNDWGPSTLDALNSKTANQYVKERGGKWVVVKKDDGSVIGTHDSKEQAESAFRGMEMNMHGGKVADGKGNTDLDGPSPKMNKEKWTPENVKKYKEESQRWPTEEKDPVEPIKAVNDDELKEIGEKTTESQDLPAGSEDKGGGFADGGESKGPSTKTWPKGKHEVDPVTKEAISHRIADWGWGDMNRENEVLGPEDFHNYDSSPNPDDKLIAEHDRGLHQQPIPDCPSCQGYHQQDPFAGLDEGGLMVHHPSQDWTR